MNASSLAVAAVAGLILGLVMHQKSRPGWEFLAYIAPFLLYLFKTLGHMLLDNGVVSRPTFFLFGAPVFGLIVYGCTRGVVEISFQKKHQEAYCAPPIWRYMANGKLHTAGDASELLRMVDAGEIPADALVGTSGMGCWIRAEDVKSHIGRELAP